LTILSDLRQTWRAYRSRRLWAFGVLFGLLSVLGLIQYHWINQVGEAESQRARASLNTALSRVGSDFDVEITRAFAFFEVPAASLSEYSERYRQWVRFAPYPELVRGVYIFDERTFDGVPKPLIAGEPSIGSGEWQKVIAKLTLPFVGTTLSGPIRSRAGLQIFSQAGVVSASRVLKPEVMIDGNPAFAFPIPPEFTSPEASRGPASASRSFKLTRDSGPVPFPRWGLLVLDASYIQTILLPRLVKGYFPKAASDYDILIVEETADPESRVIFRSEAAPPESKFVRPDGSINLLHLRMDCFLPSSSMNETRVVASTSGVNVLTSPNGLAEFLTRKPEACSIGLPLVAGSAGLWKMLVKYRAGSLDQAMAVFRQRNLLLGGGVLLVLALGILALIAFTERARALAQMQTEFVLGVSHELRTPLAVICLAADNLKKGMIESSAEARKYGEIVSTHASELSHMIEETLAFARVESTGLAPRTTAISPEQMVRTSLANCERALQDAGMELEIEIAPDLPLVDVDIRLMTRCLENLIQNATKYAAAGRWLAIRATKARRATGEWVQISVEDRGPGISSLDLPHIFEAFYRGRRSAISQIPGVGLGLTLVKRAVESHRGIVEVESSEVTGTSFCLILPAHLGQHDVQKAPSV
jgi:signal transduction histidine kinase